METEEYSAEYHLESVQDIFEYTNQKYSPNTCSLQLEFACGKESDIDGLRRDLGALGVKLTVQDVKVLGLFKIGVNVEGEKTGQAWDLTAIKELVRNICTACDSNRITLFDVLLGPIEGGPTTHRPATQ